MSTTGKWIFFSGYLLAATWLFLYLLFPEKTIRDFAKGRFAQIRPDLYLEIDRVRPFFPPGLRFDAVAVQADGNPLWVFEKIRLSPELATLFSRSPAYGFIAKSYDGTLKGRFRMYDGLPEERLSGHARIQDLDLEKLPVTQSLSGFSLSGKLQGEVLLNKDRREQVDVNAQLEVVEAAVEMAAPLFALKTLSFKSIQADLKVHGRTLILRHLLFKGPQVDGRISGSIFLRNNLRQSVLNLTGKVKPNHLLLAGIGKGFQSLFFSSNKKSLDGIAFRINGTIERPNLSLDPLS